MENERLSQNAVPFFGEPGNALQSAAWPREKQKRIAQLARGGGGRGVRCGGGHATRRGGEGLRWGGGGAGPLERAEASASSSLDSTLKKNNNNNTEPADWSI